MFRKGYVFKPFTLRAWLSTVGPRVWTGTFPCAVSKVENAEQLVDKGTVGRTIIAVALSLSLGLAGPPPFWDFCGQYRARHCAMLRAEANAAAIAWVQRFGEAGR